MKLKLFSFFIVCMVLLTLLSVPAFANTNMQTSDTDDIILVFNDGTTIPLKDWTFSLATPQYMMCSVLATGPHLSQFHWVNGGFWYNEGYSKPVGYFWWKI